MKFNVEGIEIVDLSMGGSTKSGGQVLANGVARNRGSTTIEGIVYHHTGPGEAAAHINYSQQAKTGANFYIDTDGTVYMYAEPGSRFMNNIRSPGDQARGDAGKPTAILRNSNVIGIEIIAADDKAVTAAQARAAEKLAEGLMSAFPTIKSDFIVGHGEIQNGSGRYTKQPTEGMTAVKAIRGALQSVDQESRVAAMMEPPTPLKRPQWYGNSAIEAIEIAAATEERQATKAIAALAYGNQNVIRNKPVSSYLEKELQIGVTAVYGPDYRVEIASGSGPYGSARHRDVDHGYAADVWIYAPDGRRLTPEEMRPLGQHWLANKIGSVGMPQPDNGNMLHLDLVGGSGPGSRPLRTGGKKPETLYWTYPSGGAKLPEGPPTYVVDPDMARGALGYPGIPRPRPESLGGPRLAAIEADAAEGLNSGNFSGQGDVGWFGRAMQSERLLQQVTFMSPLEMQQASANEAGGVDFRNTAMYGVDLRFSSMIPPADTFATSTFGARIADPMTGQLGAELPPPTPKEPVNVITSGRPETGFDTLLSTADEKRFQDWRSVYRPFDTGEDYDLRGAWAAGLTADPISGHFPDTFKKPNHPTFSVESQYAAFAPELAGSWVGDTYLPSIATRASADRFREVVYEGILPDVTGRPPPADGLTMTLEGVTDGRPRFVVDGEMDVRRATIPTAEAFPPRKLSAILLSPTPMRLASPALSFTPPKSLAEALGSTAFAPVAQTLDLHFSDPKSVGGADLTGVAALQKIQDDRDARQMQAITTSTSTVKPGAVRTQGTLTQRQDGTSSMQRPADTPIPKGVRPNVPEIVAPRSSPGVGNTGTFAQLQQTYGSVEKMKAPVATVPKTAGIARPATRSIVETVPNPAYQKWQETYGTGGANKTLLDIHDRREAAQMAAQTPKTMAIPEPPPKTIQRKREVLVAAKASSAPIGGGGYVVQPGDTLSQIAARSGTTVAELQRLNGLSNPNRIAAGANLKLPGKVSGGGGAAVVQAGGNYLIRKGDTLSDIAARTGTSVAALQAANGIKDANKIYAGASLVIPKASSSKSSGIAAPGATYSTSSSKSAKPKTVLQYNFQTFRFEPKTTF